MKMVFSDKFKILKWFLEEEQGGMVKKGALRFGALAFMASLTANPSDALSGVCGRERTGSCVAQCEATCDQTLTGPAKIGIWAKVEGKCCRDCYDCWARAWDGGDADEELEDYYITSCDGQGCEENLEGRDDKDNHAYAYGYRTFGMEGYVDHQNSLNITSEGTSSDSEIRAEHAHAIIPACPGQGIMWWTDSEVKRYSGSEAYVFYNCYCVTTDETKTEATVACGSKKSLWGGTLEVFSDWGWFFNLIIPVLGTIVNIIAEVHDNHQTLSRSDMGIMEGNEFNVHFDNLDLDNSDCESFSEGDMLELLEGMVLEEEP